MRLLAAALAGVLVALAHSMSVPAPAVPQRTADWRGVDCGRFSVPDPSGSGVTCGYVTAPLRHAEPTGPTIELATVVIPADAPGRQPDPLFLARGDPGESTIAAYAPTLIERSGARPVRDRDIVLTDQRGTGSSRPALQCPEVSEADLQQAMGGGPGVGSLVPYEDCHERMSEEVRDLSAFNSAEAAGDVENVRAALGYGRFNLYGGSYGAELAQFVMRQQPSHLRSVTLDGARPLSVDLVTEPAFAQQRLASAYFRSCAGQPRCAAAFPILGPRFLALLDRLDTHPITVAVSPLHRPAQTDPIRLTGSLFEAAVYDALSAPVAQAVIPLVVDRAVRGDYTFAANLVLPLALFGDTVAAGAAATVVCADHGDTNLAAVDFSGLAPRLATAELQTATALLEICRDWGIALLPRADLRQVRSDIPALLLSGADDPIAPPEYAAAVASTLPNAQAVVLPAGSHGQAVANPCANSLVQRFVDDPSVRLDASCAATQVQPFTTDADVIAMAPARDALAAGGPLGILLATAMTAPGVLGVLVLLGAIVGYAIAGIVRRSRRLPLAGDDRAGSGRAWSRAGPWLAAAAGAVLLAFLAGMGIAVAATLAANEALIDLGVIGSGWRWLFVLPLAGALLVALMAVATVALWRDRRRTLVGRLFYSLATLSGLAIVVTLVAQGVAGAWRV